MSCYSEVLATLEKPSKLRLKMVVWVRLWLETQKMWFSSWLYRRLLQWPWVSHLIAPCLSFPFCNMRGSNKSILSAQQEHNLDEATKHGSLVRSEKNPSWKYTRTALVFWKKCSDTSLSQGVWEEGNVLNTGDRVISTARLINRRRFELDPNFRILFL